ncbi:efflux transporter outer membrane subunit [Sphaerotilus sp.]|uniref:efflux transporter outer membrane subunit n=1 Tax=Sphaerotilus sp. TaxID=2093942 RepID=UPI0034E2F0B6
MRARFSFTIRVLSRPLPTALAALGLLAGCGTAPPLKPPPGLSANLWQAPLPHAGRTADLTRWWQQFDDPLLPALVDEAQATHPLLAQAVARVEQARAAQRISAAAGWPGTTANAQASRGATAATGFNTVSQLGAGVDAGWEIDLFGRVRQGVQAAQARAAQAELGWHDARISLAAEVAQTYLGLRTCEALVALYTRESDSLGRSAALVQRKADVGFEAPVHARLTQAAAAQARDRVAAQQTECALATQALAMLTGSTADGLHERLATRTARLPIPSSFTVATLPAATLAQRPDLAAAEQELQASAAEVGVAEAARWPQLTLNGSIGIGLVRAGGTTTDALTWGFGPNLTLPVFDHGRLQAQADAARARYDEARAGYAVKLRSAVREVEEALLRIDASQRREADARTAAEGLRSVLTSTEERTRLGAASVLETEDARRQTLSAEATLLALQREQVAAWISLYRAVGGGWTRGGDALPVRTSLPGSPA